MEPARPILKEVTVELTQLDGPKWNPERIKKTVLWTVVGLSVCLALYLSDRWFIYSETHISTDNAFIDADFYSINCRIMGYVKEILVAENQAVKKGQILALLDDTDFKVELSYKTAKLKKTKADMARAEMLLRTKAISHSDYELAEANLTANQADYDGTILKLKYTQVLSPADGVIGKKTVDLGQYVQPGQGLFMVVPNEPLWIKANYKETQLRRIKIGQRVEIKVDAYPNQMFFGHVDGIFPSSGSRLSILPPENATGNFTKIVQRIPVRIRLDQKSSVKLRPGMSVTSTILAQE